MPDDMPRIIVWDIESAHNVAAVFSLFQDSVPSTNVLQEKYIICAAYKVLGEKRVHGISILDDPDRFSKDPNDDYYVVNTIHEVLSGADAIVHHYGDNFDIKLFNARAIHHGLTPVPDIIQIDTYKIAKSKFKFNSNKLDYIGRYLGFGGKMPTPPGLWLDCLRGDRAAIKKMLAYNKQDVTLLEQVYLKIAPYAPAKLNVNRFLDEDAAENLVCPLCGGEDLQSRGTRLFYTRVTKFRRFQCNDCGYWSKAPMLKDGALGKLR